MRWPRDRQGRPRWLLEAPLLVGGYLLFGLARFGVDRGNPAATATALVVQQWERAIRFDIEHPLNHAMLDQPVLMQTTGYYYRLCLLTVPAMLIWSYLARPDRYRGLRTLLVVITLADLPLVLLFPESPPRFALSGIVDYLAIDNIAFSGGSRTPRFGVNLLAAMPSMHVAWTTWSAYAARTMLRESHPTVSRFVWLLPLLTAFDVLATGNHYVLDVLAAWILVATAIVGTDRIMVRADLRSGH